MKLLKYSLYVSMVFAFSSCLKAKNDVGGLLTDQGEILSSISESQYLHTDEQNIGFHYTHGSIANVAFGTGTESVKFFTLKVSQARNKKMSGDMTLTVKTSPVAGYDQLPAGAVTFSNVTIPANSAPVFEVPVKFTVNKAALDPTKWYAVNVELASVSQGVINATDKSIDVIFNIDPTYNTSRYTGRYVATTTVEDSAKVFGINQNTRTYMLSEGQYDPFGFAGGPAFSANLIYPTDLYAYAFGLVAESFSLMTNNLTTGIRQATIQPVYRLDASGKVIDVLNRSTLTSLNPVFDNSAPNSFVITSNNERVLSVKYKVLFTLGGLTRSITVTDRYVYDKIQVTY